MAHRAVETRAVWLPPGKNTHHKRLFAYTCTHVLPHSHPISDARVSYLALEEPFKDMHILLCLPAVVYLHPKGVVNVVFSRIMFALDTVKRKGEGGRRL